MSIVFRGTRDDIRRIAAQLAAMLSGSAPDNMNVGRGVLLAIGVAALSDIKDAYITKARGGTDEMGVTWPKLSREYLAYGRRFGKTEKAGLLKGAGLNARKNNQRGLLTAEQNKAWKAIFARQLARWSVSMPLAAAKARAGQMAWAYVKKEMGAKTKLEVFGNRQVEILRDTGILFNSLSPGLMGGAGPTATYSRPTAPGGSEQIFRITPGEVTVGTTVAYANAHDKGIKVPRRQILPESSSQVPAVWWDRWTAVGLKALAIGAEQLIRRSA